MKLTGQRISGFLRSPDRNLKAVLLHGPDQGLVRERGKALAVFFLDGSDDPFSMTELSGDQVRSDPALLSDSARGLSLMGGESVVRVRDAADVLTATIDGWLAEPKLGNPVIFEAGELAARSKLRQLLEKHEEAVSIACYPDEGRDLQRTVGDHLSAAGVRIEREALELLTARLGADRMAVRQELDKVVTFAGAGGDGSQELSVDDIDALIGDSSEDKLEEIAFAAASGALDKLLGALEGARANGESEIGIIRVALRHFDRLLSVRSSLDTGANIDAAVKALKPPVFFKFMPAMKQQAGIWSRADITRAIELLLEAEVSCKSGSGIEAAICERTLTQVAMAARRKRV